MKCLRCGEHENAPSQKFCGECGASLPQGISATSSPSPEHLAEKILTSRMALEGERENATRLADRSLRLSRDAHERGYDAWALRLLGDITSRRDPADVVLAEGCYHRALALADELGMRPLAA